MRGETADDDWLKKSDLAVTFLDRYGTPGIDGYLGPGTNPVVPDKRKPSSCLVPLAGRGS
jgi:hypothetical protein